MQYRRREAVVEAFRFEPDAEITAPEWFMNAVEKGDIYIDRCIWDGAAHVYGCTIGYVHGKLRAKVGDYLVREPGGKIWPYKAKEFKRQYERI